ncbi:polyhydroxyalkanoate depolymerase [Trinickia sp. EG282A]|uniref:polyhydroxyalkanoate depolymerase n=1 Tax=Trinickia sp. EG282A TaxID=3237013 RepID=UPI0034D18A8F
MLYNWLETQRALIRSMDTWAASLARACGLPAQSPESRAMPGCEWLRRVFETTLEPPPFAIASVTLGGRRVHIDETVVDRVAFCALRRFARRGEHRARLDGGAPILLCTPLAGHHAVMLRETVETLLEDGDVYVTDWANARDVPLAEGRFGLDDYVLTVERFMRRLCSNGLHVLAVCQGTVPAVAAAALVAARGEPGPLSVTLMGGPIDTRLNPTAVDRLAATHSIDWFRRTVIDTVPAWYRGGGRRIYPGYLQHAAIVAAHPHRQMALETRYWTSRLAGDDARIAASRRAFDEYAAVLDMTEDYFLDTLRIVFKEQRLARGAWDVDGRRVRGSALAASALCTIEGDRDDITGAGQTHAAHAVCSAVPDRRRKQLTIADCDHYDLFTGPRWREAIHPALAAFWRETHEPHEPHEPQPAAIS